MNTSSGQIHEMNSTETLAQLSRRIGVAEGILKEMKVPPTIRQRLTGVVGKYDPCPCGSGKKFKWCCYTGSGSGTAMTAL
jgi:uncharacterized protein YecA (UPF0149 family)